MQWTRFGQRPAGDIGTVVKVGLALVILAIAGCSETEQTGNEALISTQATAEETDDLAAAVPTLAELQTKLELREEQQVELAAALEVLRDGIAARHEAGQRGQGGVGTGEPPVHQFIQRAAGVLDQKQLVTMLRVLADRSEEHRAERASGEHRFARGDRPDRGTRHLEKMREELGLTDEQYTAMQEAAQQMHEALRALHEQYGADASREAIHEAARTIHEQFRQQQQEILTDEQQAKLEELHAERRESRQEQHQEMMAERNERHTEFLTEVLALTEEQQAQLGAIIEQTHADIEALHERIKNEQIAREDAHEALQALHEESTAAIREMLTSEQAEILDALNDLRAAHGGPGHGPHPGHGGPRH